MAFKTQKEMEQVINVSYPKQLALSLKMQENEFVQEMQKLSIIKLYELGKISSSVAAKILNLSRVDFIELINKYQVSIFSNTLKDELLNDLKNA
jgi:predicted HTH domain antitoxin